LDKKGKEGGRHSPRFCEKKERKAGKQKEKKGKTHNLPFQVEGRHRKKASHLDREISLLWQKKQTGGKFLRGEKEKRKGTLPRTKGNALCKPRSEAAPGRLGGLSSLHYLKKKKKKGKRSSPPPNRKGAGEGAHLQKKYFRTGGGKEERLPFEKVQEKKVMKPFSGERGLLSGFLPRELITDTEKGEKF